MADPTDRTSTSSDTFTFPHQCDEAHGDPRPCRWEPMPSDDGPLLEWYWCVEHLGMGAVSTFGGAS